MLVMINKIIRYNLFENIFFQSLNHWNLVIHFSRYYHHVYVAFHLISAEKVEADIK